ncbi:MAG: Holliday junction branch migration protein RuvA [Lachnospiraceae bacterium]|nr:Holliday junction branch migration protein RuvA [Lachnospiraceae bacterium]
MIAYIRGELESIENDAVLIDVGGMGYRVYTPVNEQLLRMGVGSTIKLHTYLNVREDAMVLFGFLNKEDLELFELLITVSGVGPRSALQILSSMSAAELILAISRDDKKTLTTVNGIGAKTAARIILDLKEKVHAGSPSDEETSGAVSSPAVLMPQGAAQEAVMALVSLGYSQTEAEKAVKTVALEGMPVETILRQCLKILY